MGDRPAGPAQLAAILSPYDYPMRPDPPSPPVGTCCVPCYWARSQLVDPAFDPAGERRAARAHGCGTGGHDHLRCNSRSCFGDHAQASPTPRRLNRVFPPEHWGRDEAASGPPFYDQFRCGHFASRVGARVGHQPAEIRPIQLGGSAVVLPPRAPPFGDRPFRRRTWSRHARHAAA